MGSPTLLCIGIFTKLDGRFVKASFRKMREIKNREKLKGRALDGYIEKKLLKFLESSRTFWKILEYSRR